MKLLIVAHPDDEILWFNPKKFDKIIIVFQHRLDKKWMGEARQRVIDKHPLRNKIQMLGYTESGYRLHKGRKDLFIKNFNDLVEVMPKILSLYDTVYTHNPWGEYNHPDHVLVYQAVKEIAYEEDIFCFDGITPTTPLETKLETIDLDLYREIKLLYQKERAWTWASNYEPQGRQPYFRVN